MPSTIDDLTTTTTPSVPFPNDNQEFFTNAYMDLESYFELPPGENSTNTLQEQSLATAPSSPVLEGIDLWDSAGRDSPGVSSFNPTLTGGLASLNEGPTPSHIPAGISPLQTTIAPSAFLGHPSPPDSSESSPNKFEPREAEGISPLDSLICQLPVDLPGSRTIHGQVTPPEDLESSPKMQNRRFSLRGPSELSPPPTRKQSFADDYDSRDYEENGRKRRSSTSTSASTSRKTRKNNSGNTTAEPPDLQEAKRRRFLERNRVAASKCRQKKKAWMADLESEAREAQAKSKQLKHCVSMFREEILQLKTELLKHNTCECTPIRQYLTNEATKLGTTGQTAKVLETSPTLQKAEQHYAQAMQLNAGERFAADTPEFDLYDAHVAAENILNAP